MIFLAGGRRPAAWAAALRIPRERWNRTVPDIYTPTKRSEIMSRIGGSRTAPEETVARMFRSLGLRYRRHVKALPGKPDFVLRAKRTVVLVNGCFWHGHKNCKRAGQPGTNREFWSAKIEGNRKRDVRTQKALRRAGWHVWVVWQCRLRKPEQVLRRLRKLL